MAAFVPHYPPPTPEKQAVFDAFFKNIPQNARLTALTGCTREVLFAMWCKYSVYPKSPVRKPYAIFFICFFLKCVVFFCSFVSINTTGRIYFK